MAERQEVQRRRRRQSRRTRRPKDQSEEQDGSLQRHRGGQGAVGEQDQVHQRNVQCLREQGQGELSVFNSRTTSADPQQHQDVRAKRPRRLHSPRPERWAFESASFLHLAPIVALCKPTLSHQQEALLKRKELKPSLMQLPMTDK